MTGAELEQLFHRAFIATPGTTLRAEERKKCLELSGLLTELSRISRKSTLVDAAAGKASVGLFAAHLLGFPKVVVFERNPARLRDAREASARLDVQAKVEFLEGDVADAALWPAKADAVVALHACGPASDAIIDASIAREVPWLFVVPCCYSAKLSFWAEAHRRAERAGVPDDALVRGRFVQSLIDTERVLRLEAGGYQTETVSFVAPTVTPHHLLLRARRTNDARRRQSATQRHRAFLEGAPSGDVRPA